MTKPGAKPVAARKFALNHLMTTGLFETNKNGKG